MVTAPAPPADVALRLIHERFLNRTDVVAILAPWGKPNPAVAAGTLDDLLRTHLLGQAAAEAAITYTNRRGSAAIKGRFRVGSYAPATDGTTRWLCIDFDGAGHAGALADPEQAARSTQARFTEAGLPAYLERSGGAKGYHLWSFFDPPIPAAEAQAVGHALAPRDALLTEGGCADPRSGRGIEVFPKQPNVRQRGFGNLVWLPWWSGAAPGGCSFYRPGESGALEVFAPEELAPAPAEAVQRVLATIPKSTKKRRGRPRAAAEDAPQATAAPDPSAPSPARDNVWKEWRAKAVAALPLEAIYGAWLTGKVAGPGWLESRDPGSPSGDQTPSASVADGTGEAERGSFHSFISGRTVSVFDFLVEHGGLADFPAASARVAELSGVEPPNVQPPTSGAATGRQRLPEIQVNNRQLRDVVRDAWRAVHARNDPPTLFARAGQLVRLLPTEHGPTITAMEDRALYGHIARVANWVRVTQQAVLDAHPSKEVAHDMGVYVSDGLPVLEAIVTAPLFDGEGRLVATPGYHPEARLYYHRLPGFEVPAVPERPTSADVAAARSLLFDDLFVDFPFASQADRAHALLTLLLPFVRRMVGSFTPIHLIEATTPGSGKGLLADLVSIVATGRACEPTTISADEDETRKKLTSMLLRAPTIILLDNLRGGLDSSQLASMITADPWTDRLLGQTQILALPNRVAWLATGNNPNLSTEIMRRCIRIRLEPKTDRPWERTTFKHPVVRKWATDNRARLVHAVLVLVRHWLASGRPAAARTLGSFEAWAEVMGGILEAVGVDGFLGNAPDLYGVADLDGQEWRSFVGIWHERYGSQSVLAGDLLDLALDNELLGQAIGDGSRRAQAIRLGKALLTNRGRQFGHLQIECGARIHNQLVWRVVAATASAAAPPEASVVTAPPVAVPDLARLDELA